MSYRSHSSGASRASLKPRENSSKASPAQVTIVAVATPPGVGGIAVLRISGPAARDIAQAVLGALPAPRHAVHCTFRDPHDMPIDRGIALYFPAPRSFTGEDVIELHAHAAPVVLDMLLKRVVDLGARMARPGEFSERAFLNGKMDLAQAEAVADLINAGSEAAARSALNSLTGVFSRRINAIVENLVHVRTYVEAAIDFPEDEIDFLGNERVASELSIVADQLDELLSHTQQGCLLQAGMTVVLAGAPNAGKSSLLNALAGEDAAIVSPTPGTTRDVVRSRIDLDGMPMHVLDTAGLRPSTDPIEQEGVTRARAAMAQADRVLLVIDDSTVADGGPEPQSRDARCTRVYNKIDLTGRAPGVFGSNPDFSVAVSAKTGAGLDHLRAHLKQCAGFEPAGAGSFIARRRHLDALTRARAHVADGQNQLKNHRAGELVAEDLRRGQQALGEITGEFTSEDLLSRIFSSFCIGK